MRRRHLLPALAAACGAGRVLAQVALPGTATELAIVVPPLLSPAAVLDMVRPLREHLQRRLGRPVAFYTAVDYRVLFDAVMRGEHPVVALPSHMAALAVADAGYQPLVALQQDTALMVMVRAGSPVQRPADLKGGRIGMLDPLSLTAITARQWLLAQQLVPGRDVQIVYQPAINTGVVALERGEIDALAMTSFQFSVLRSEPGAQLRLLAQGPVMLAPLLLAHERLGTAAVSQLRQALLDFQPDTGRPTGVFNAPLYPLGPQALQSLRSLAEPAREMLKTPR